MRDGPWGSWTPCFTGVPGFTSGQLSVSTEGQSKGQPSVASPQAALCQDQTTKDFMELVCVKWHILCPDILRSPPQPSSPDMGTFRSRARQEEHG